MGYAACEVSYIGGTPKWIVYDGTSYSSMDDLGVPPPILGHPRISKKL